jgi:hypothetical protein
MIYTMKNLNTFALNVQFNISDKARTYNNVTELYKSIVFTPANASGAFRNVGYELSYYHRRAAINAAIRFFLGTDRLYEAVHLYDKDNPLHKGGSMGWLMANAVFVAPGSIKGRINIEGKTYFADMPTRKVETSKGGRIAQVNITTPWLTIEGATISTIMLKNAPLDSKSGFSFGVLLHEYMADLYAGTRLTIPVALEQYFGAKDKTETILMTNLQEKAQYLARILNVKEAKDSEGKVVHVPGIKPTDVPDLRKDFIDNKVAWAATSEFEKQMEKSGLLTAEDVQIASESTKAQMNGEEFKPSGLVVMIDAKAVPVENVPSGRYLVVTLDKQGREVSSERAPINITRGATGKTKAIHVSKSGKALRTLKAY